MSKRITHQRDRFAAIEGVRYVDVAKPVRRHIRKAGTLGCGVHHPLGLRACARALQRAKDRRIGILRILTHHKLGSGAVGAQYHVHLSAFVVERDPAAIRRAHVVGSRRRIAPAPPNVNRNAGCIRGHLDRAAGPCFANSVPLTLTW